MDTTCNESAVCPHCGVGFLEYDNFTRDIYWRQQVKTPTAKAKKKSKPKKKKEDTKMRLF